MLNNALSKFSEFVYKNTAKNGLESLNNQEIIKMINELSIIFPNNSSFKLPIPRMVCVGGQSSGKSSVLNGLIGMNILPTGKEMVTRCPLNLQLVHVDSQNAYAEFSNLKISLTLPEPTEDEVHRIQQQIKKLTNEYAGYNKNISSTEILLKIYSPNVPNLSLVDLPGLTLIPCIDKGQPRDIKEQIRNLAISYIRNRETIILTVMAAREDLETDMGLELAKEFDEDGERTCGVLTKIDLMNKDNNIVNYLTNNISVNLQLNYGYFGVNNVSHNSMTQSLVEEEKYFQSHEDYGSLSKDRLGRKNLGTMLSKILVDHIKTKIPEIVHELQEQEVEIMTEVNRLGLSMDDKSDDEKKTHVYMYMSNLCNQLKDGLVNKGGINHGRYLKNEFIEFRENVRKIKYTLSDEYVKKNIDNCNGNHMDFSIFSIDILENCLKDPDQKIFTRMIPNTNKLVTMIENIVLKTIDAVIESAGVSRFHVMKKFVKTEMSNYLMVLSNNIRKRIDDMLEMERMYIWTDDVNFNKSLKGLFQTLNDNQSQIKIINTLVNMYMETVKNTVSDQIPKIVMCFMIHEFLNNVYNVLINKISEMDVNKLLAELPEVEKKRLYFKKKMKLIEKGKNILHQ